MKVIGETGNRYGKLLVLKRTENNRHGGAVWLCRCDCGNEKVVAGSNLRHGYTKSCGCLPTGFRALPEGEAAFNVLFTRIRCRAKAHGRAWELTREQVKILTKQPCFYCGKPPSRIVRGGRGDYAYNGIDRMDNDLGYTESNCVPCCRECNRKKYTMSVDQFIENLNFGKDST